MLQKLENAYLAILRFVVLAVAGLLLVGVVLFGLGAFKLMGQEPQPLKTEPVVTADQMIASLKKQPAAGVDTLPKEEGQGGKVDARNDPYYAKTVDAIDTFVRKISNGASSANREKLIDLLKEYTETKIKEPGHQDAYKQGLANVMQKTLADPAIIRSAHADAPFMAPADVLDNYTASFNSQIDQVNAKNAAAHQKYLDERAEGMQGLYYAGAAFGIFLAVVFLSIIIRIERNLRNLERLPAKPETEERHPLPAAESAQL